MPPSHAVGHYPLKTPAFICWTNWFQNGVCACVGVCGDVCVCVCVQLWVWAQGGVGQQKTQSMQISHRICNSRDCSRRLYISLAIILSLGSHLPSIKCRTPGHGQARDRPILCADHQTLNVHWSVCLRTWRMKSFHLEVSCEIYIAPLG